MRKSNNDIKRIERLLLRKGVAPPSHTKAVGDDLVLEFATVLGAQEARKTFIHNKVAAEQYLRRVWVFPKMREEKQQYKGRSAA